MPADLVACLDLSGLAEMVGPFAYSGVYKVSAAGEVGELAHISFRTPDPWGGSEDGEDGPLSHALIIDHNGRVHRHNRADRIRARYAVLAEAALLPCVSAARVLAARAVAAVAGAGLLDDERPADLQVHYGSSFRGGANPELLRFEFRLAERLAGGRVLLFAHSRPDDPASITLDGAVPQFLLAGAVLRADDQALAKLTMARDLSWAGRVPALEDLIAPGLGNLIPAFLEGF
jgi:hypothetical protein